MQAPNIAHHYRHAARTEDADLAWVDDHETLTRLRENAVTWLHRAGELATRSFAIDDAVALLHQALDLDPPPDRQAQLWFAIGQAHALRYDFPPFQEAILRVVDLADDRQLQAEAYIALAEVISAWQVVASALPPDEVMEGWLQQGLALVTPGTPAHINAMMENAGWWHPEQVANLEPLILAAEQLGNHTMGRLAHAVRRCHASFERRYTDVLTWALERAAQANPDNPYTIGTSYLGPIPPLMAMGRFDEAREYATRNETIAQQLLPEDRAAAAAWRIEVDTIACEWARIYVFEHRTRHLIPTDTATPAVTSVRMLLHCAAARVHLGQPAAAALETMATKMAGGHDDRIIGPQLRLALARGDLHRLADLIAVAPRRLKPFQMWWDIDLSINRLDTLAALGDVPAVEADAASVRGTCDLLDAVAIRALGRVHRDPALLADAATLFERMNLPAHVALTRRSLRLV